MGFDLEMNESVKSCNRVKWAFLYIVREVYKISIFNNTSVVLSFFITEMISIMQPIVMYENKDSMIEFLKFIFIMLFMKFSKSKQKNLLKLEVT